MKKWLKSYGISILFIIAALFMVYNGAQSFLSNRHEVIHRWNFTGFTSGLIFLSLGVAHFFEVNGKKRFSSILNIICGSVIAIFGLIIMFVFDSVDSLDFIMNVLMLVGLPGFLILISIIKLSGKDQLVTKKGVKVIEIVLVFVILVLIAFLVWAFTYFE